MSNTQNLENKVEIGVPTELRKKVWNSGQAFALLAIFMIGILLIFLSPHIDNEYWREVLKDIGIALAPAAAISQLFRVFLFEEIKYELNKPIEELNEVTNIISTIGRDIEPLKNEIKILSQSAENGLRRIYKNRASALKEFKNALHSENDEITIIGSSLLGFLQNESYTTLKELIKEKNSKGVTIRIMLTHPSVADFRARLENRRYTDIGKEIIQSLGILCEMKIPAKNVKLYKGTPTIFGIKTSSFMLINPYPYKGQAMTSPCFELGAGKSLYEAYSEKHFEAWNSNMAEEFTDWTTKIAELNNNLNVFAKEVSELIPEDYSKNSK